MKTEWNQNVEVFVTWKTLHMRWDEGHISYWLLYNKLSSPSSKHSSFKQQILTSGFWGSGIWEQLSWMVLAQAADKTTGKDSDSSRLSWGNLLSSSLTWLSAGFRPLLTLKTEASLPCHGGPSRGQIPKHSNCPLRASKWKSKRRYLRWESRLLVT